MAIINNNVENVKFLRNQTPFESRELARQALENNKAQAADGTALLARYTITDGQTTDVKTLVGFVAEVNSTKYVTIVDVEGGSADVEKLRQEINAKLGTSVTSANTATAQLAALSGGTFVPGTSSSANTSVEGAKAYAYDLIGTLDYTDTAETGSYVSKVDQVDGVISTTKTALPSVTDSAVAKKVVIAVSENKGQIEVTRGEISSSAQTIVLNDNADGGIDFDVNIDGQSIVKDANGVLSVASTALTQYVGDDDTIQISAAVEGVKTVSSPLTIQKVTTGLSEEVKEEYRLVGASGTTIGDPVKIYKDSHIVSIDYIDDPADPNYQKLEYVYVNDSGATSTTYVDMSELVLEAEFASGLTIENHVARGVVDQTSEKDSQETPVDFLTVGEDGFKVGGIKDEIDRKINALDATGGTQTIATDKHVAVEVIEANGLITAVTVTEGNIADADDLATLSASTISGITSTGGSISVVSDNAAGNKSVNIETDADKIKMSGFTSVGALSGITPSSSITDAFGVVEDVIEENERITAGALTDLDGRLDVVEDKYISGVSVNGKAVTVADKVAPISITPATSAATATSTEAIVVNTDNSGNITLGIANIDCGYYDGTQG